MLHPATCRTREGVELGGVDDSLAEGHLVFVIGLIANTAEIKRIGAPTMGVFLLIALALHGWALWTRRGATGLSVAAT